MGAKDDTNVIDPTHGTRASGSNNIKPTNLTTDGRRVTVMGLKNSLEHNGESGTITEVKENGRRYVVHLDNDQHISVKKEAVLPENHPQAIKYKKKMAEIKEKCNGDKTLNDFKDEVISQYRIYYPIERVDYKKLPRHMGPTDANLSDRTGATHEKDAPQKSARPNPFNLGDTVKVHGLRNAAQHNDKNGVIESYDAVKQRYGVKLESGKQISVKEANLNHLDTEVANERTQAKLAEGTAQPILALPAPEQLLKALPEGELREILEQLKAEHGELPQGHTSDAVGKYMAKANEAGDAMSEVVQAAIEIYTRASQQYSQTRINGDLVTKFQHDDGYKRHEDVVADLQ